MKVIRCPDGHFRHAIFSLGPYIADYPEQVWLSGVVSNWCPKYVSVMLHCTWIVNKYLGVMLSQQILMALEVINAHMKRQTFSSTLLIQESYGMSLGSGMILWLVFFLVS